MASETSDETGAREDTTQVSSSIVEENNENRDLAFCIYKEVWDEFNRWKVEDCRQQLRLLQKPLPPPNVTEAARMMASAFRTGDLDDVETIYICDTDDDVPLNPGGATVLTCKNVLLRFREPVIEPHPRYEFCTSSVQSIALRIESQSLASDELETVLFVPYADDPAFNALAYLEQFKFFSWENLADPDGKLSTSAIPPSL
jgi:histone-lysine N-methyltransferase EZH2